MSKTNLTIYNSIFIFCLIILINTKNVNAADGTMYHETSAVDACKVFNGNGYSSNEYFVNSKGHIYNNSTSSMLFMCSFPKITTELTSKRISGGIYVVDNSSYDNVSCKFYRGSSTGSYYYSYLNTYGSSLSSRPFFVSIPNNSKAYGFMHMSCQIPGKVGSSKSGILGIYHTLYNY